MTQVQTEKWIHEPFSRVDYYSMAVGLICASSEKSENIRIITMQPIIVQYRDPFLT